jgi:hypothetical protein
MLLLGIILLSIWVTLAFVKHEALIFVCIVMVVGLAARQLTKWLANRKGPQVSLLKRAIYEQWPENAAIMPKILVGTYGSDALAAAAFATARQDHAALVVCFIRQVSLSYKWDQALTIDSDLAAQRTFARYLDLGHQYSVPVIPVYDMGANAAELMAENAAIYGCSKALIGTSRNGALYHMIKGHFQTRLENLLPDDVKVEVIGDNVPVEPAVPAVAVN